MPSLAGSKLYFVSDRQGRQTQGFRLKPVPAVVDHLMQPFLKPPAAAARP